MDEAIKVRMRVMRITRGLRWGFTSLSPVSPRTGHKHGSLSNCAFWHYAPSGNAQINYRQGTSIPLEVGGYVDLDLLHRPEAEDDDERARRNWRLHRAGVEEGKLHVVMGLSYYRSRVVQSGDLTFRFDNRESWHPFRDAGEGSLWQVNVQPLNRGVSHAGCSYTDPS